MDKLQAEAVLKAMLEPDLDVQMAIRTKRTEKALKLKAQRQRAGSALVGMVAGTAVGYVITGRFSYYAVFGAWAGVAAYVLAQYAAKRTR